MAPSVQTKSSRRDSSNGSTSSGSGSRTAASPSRSRSAAKTRQKLTMPHRDGGEGDDDMYPRQRGVCVFLCCVHVFIINVSACVCAYGRVHVYALLNYARYILMRLLSTHTQPTQTIMTMMLLHLHRSLFILLERPPVQMWEAILAVAVAMAVGAGAEAAPHKRLQTMHLNL